MTTFSKGGTIFGCQKWSGKTTVGSQNQSRKSLLDRTDFHMTVTFNCKGVDWGKSQFTKSQIPEKKPVLSSQCWVWTTSPPAVIVCTCPSVGTSWHHDKLCLFTYICYLQFMPRLQRNVMERNQNFSWTQLSPLIYGNSIQINSPRWDRFATQASAHRSKKRDPQHGLSKLTKHSLPTEILNWVNRSIDARSV